MGCYAHWYVIRTNDDVWIGSTVPFPVSDLTIYPLLSTVGTDLKNIVFSHGPSEVNLRKLELRTSLGGDMKFMFFIHKTATSGEKNAYASTLKVMNSNQPLLTVEATHTTEGQFGHNYALKTEAKGNCILIIWVDVHIYVGYTLVYLRLSWAPPHPMLQSLH